MAQLMLINPARRPSKRRKSTGRKATPAQLRALAKARRARAGLSANPSPRRRRAMRATTTHTRRRARRNPIGMGGVMGSLGTAVWGAGGALAVGAAFNMLPLPATMKIGMMGTVSKLGLAVALGMLAKPMVGRSAGKMAEGAMTVIAYEALQSMLPTSVGGSSVAGLGYMSPGMVAGGYAAPNTSLPNMAGMGEYVSGMGEYVSGMGGYGY